MDERHGDDLAGLPRGDQPGRSTDQSNDESGGVVIPPHLHATVVTALIQAAVTWAEPSGVVEALKILVPEPPVPWDENIARVREEWENIV